jgi:hypothetical protein
MNKEWRILSWIMVFFFIGGYILSSIIHNNWTDGILVLALAALFGMYAWRGNNWPLKFFFGNVIKKGDENDYIGSIDLSWFKNLFQKKDKRRQGNNSI